MKKVIMLQPSEWIIMEKLWENPPKTIMQLYHELKEDPGWSKSTVNTLLGRMVKKDIIYYEEGKKAKLYYPKAARDDAAMTETRSLIERVYQGSVGMMMSTLIRNHNLTDEDIRELYEILGEAVDKHDSTVHHVIHTDCVHTGNFLPYEKEAWAVHQICLMAACRS